MSKFDKKIVYQHIMLRHPRCPDFAALFFANEVAERDWKNVTLGKAVGITMQNFLRHQMTDYDQLLMCGVDRHEARRRVQPRVQAMIASWSASPRKEPSKR